MTSHSDFKPGETVWYGFAWISEAQPVTRIRRAVFDVGPSGQRLLRFEDGTVDSYWESKSQGIFATHTDAVAHCTGVLAKFRADLEAEIERLLELADEGGPAPGSETPAGTAPPEVAR